MRPFSFVSRPETCLPPVSLCCHQLIRHSCMHTRKGSHRHHTESLRLLHILVPLQPPCTAASSFGPPRARALHPAMHLGPMRHALRRASSHTHARVPGVLSKTNGKGSELVRMIDNWLMSYVPDNLSSPGRSTFARSVGSETQGFGSCY